MKPLVSILVPIYGVEKYIEKCARSLFEQTYENLEYIYVNDCSPDNSVQILNEVLNDYPNRSRYVRIINQDKNSGVSAARNTSLDIASGKYLLFVDSDDYIDVDVVEKLVGVAESNNSDIVAYDMRYIFTDKSFIVHQNGIKENAKEYTCQLLVYQAGVTICGKLIKRDLFIDNNIRFVDNLNFGEDYMTSPRISYYASRISHCPSTYYNYVQYNDSSCTTAYRSKNIDDLVRALELIELFFSYKEDYAYFKKSIDEAFLINKVKLLIAVCLHYKQVGDRLIEVSNLYSNRNSSNLSIANKILLWMSRNKLFALMRFYVVLGYRIKHIVK